MNKICADLFITANPRNNNGTRIKYFMIILKDNEDGLEIRTKAYDNSK